MKDLLLENISRSILNLNLKLNFFSPEVHALLHQVCFRLQHSFLYEIRNIIVKDQGLFIQTIRMQGSQMLLVLSTLARDNTVLVSFKHC